MGPNMESSKGFSLVEVLVTLVLITVGILGMLTLQSKSIQYTQDSVNRNLAVTLANDLLGIMRAHRHEFFNNEAPFAQLKSATSIYDSNGALKLNAQNCRGLSVAQNALEQANCWLKAVEAYLPDSDHPAIKSQLRLCPSFKTGQCAGSGYQGASLELQLAWRAKLGECMDDQDGTICTYVTRIEL